jgi:pimeloyl-ACP methyl ester carboxylesterase
MAVLELGPQDKIYYEHEAPSRADAATFVFVNAITGDASMWQVEVGPALRDAGFGTLAYNFRGQAKSGFTPGTPLDEALIVGDLQRLLADLQVSKAVLVGLSIGGLYAAKAMLGGSEVSGLVLINTLRKIGLRLAWINDMALRIMEVGGAALMRDVMSPQLFGPKWLAANRKDCMVPNPEYPPLAPDTGTFSLLQNMSGADWELPYEQIQCPVLAVTGPNDRVFYEPKIVAELLARMPNATEVIFPEAGHMLPVEVGPPLAEALSKFAANL